MTSTNPIQYQIVEYIDKNLLRPVSGYSDLNQIDKCYQVFDNFRMKGDAPTGIRLTTWGKNRLAKGFESYKFENTVDLTGKILLKLDEAMTWPYYVNKKTVILFNQTDAAWYKLNGESLADYVNLI